MSNDKTRLSTDFGAPEDQSDDIDIFTLLSTLWRGRLVIGACIAAAMGLAIWYAFFVAVPLYQSNAQLSLLVETENAINLQDVLDGTTPDQNSINTEMEVVQSRGLLGQVVDDLDLISDPEFNPTLQSPGALDRVKTGLKGMIGLDAPSPTSEDVVRNMVIDQLRQTIAAVAQDKSFIFTISATTQDPLKSALLANTLAETYGEDQIAVKVAASERAAVWLSARVAELQDDIQTAENRINALRTRNTLISDEAVVALNTQSVDVNAELQDAELALNRAQLRLDTVLAAADGGYAALAAAADDSQLLALAAAADAGDAAVAARFDRRFDQLLLQRRGDLARAEEAADDLRQVAQTVTTRFEQQSAALIEIDQIERDTEATRVLYETFLTRLKETSAQIGIQRAESRVLSQAIPGYQVAPRKPILLALSVIMGLMLGSALVLIREALQNTFRTAGNLERRTGRAVLGQIPRIPAQTRAGTIGYLADKPTSAAAEAVRNLRTSILMSNVDLPSKVILSTSSIPGEGKTTIAIALAQNLAGLRKRVILIEGDIRRRKFPDYFPQAHANAGLLSVVSGRVSLREAIWTHPKSGIDVLMGEHSTVNAADVLSSDSFSKLIEHLRVHYDYVVIDTPPVLVVPDARIISTMVDAIIYAVKWDSTTQSQVDSGLKQFRDINVPVTGLVLSQIDAKGMRRYGFADQYGAYSKYAKDYYEG
ncbi:capsular exopolysaccharide family [Loktanella fryxellensis]|uniref:non-specific protein-tyrosine kinase n=1 Tax=Loktanella fryxellensis TaxID=245187 RepID=A0A1H8H5L6_9RHOB|nr:polysaccharide biosynthesis tyrosine autokinase [Loktanella fryxellensis]SEN51310.1 capsular exopolysaccharide family [Loktanella fryxellensis]